METHLGTVLTTLAHFVTHLENIVGCIEMELELASGYMLEVVHLDSLLEMKDGRRMLIHMLLLGC